MIRGIAYQKVDMTDREFEYYKELAEKYSEDDKKGSEYFRDLFETDERGVITIIKTVKSIPWSILFFIQNLMINQQLRLFDERIAKIEKANGAK